MSEPASVWCANEECGVDNEVELVGGEATFACRDCGAVQRADACCCGVSSHLLLPDVTRYPWDPPVPNEGQP